MGDTFTLSFSSSQKMAAPSIIKWSTTWHKTGRALHIIDNGWLVPRTTLTYLLLLGQFVGLIFKILMTHHMISLFNSIKYQRMIILSNLGNLQKHAYGLRTPSIVPRS